ncbi:hypothetical protein KNP414_06094 [Paenibacillus mucilaginosus KNP414]|uniref:Uncharacterized protein n=1 Tax=Paenibacillus mucilaginosus (strain KNP414) TaxID=1036673 RepID=F8FGF8_PAEMK|nr:hypothetical protein KNP414_06094 [Paenibacillus mucilaginosus KNP414]
MPPGSEAERIIFHVKTRHSGEPTQTLVFPSRCLPIYAQVCKSIRIRYNEIVI